MLGKLQQHVDEGTIRFDAFYFAFCRGAAEPNPLAHSDAVPWDDVEPKVQAIFAGQLYKMIAGTLGEQAFAAFHTGQLIDLPAHVSKFVQQRRSVEVLEEIAGRPELTSEQLLTLGNQFAYKVSTITPGPALLAIIRFHIIPTQGAKPVHFTFTSLCTLDPGREATTFDDRAGKFTRSLLTNIFSRTTLSRAALFPCLDEDGREAADLLIYDSGAAAGWWNVLECARSYSPVREAKNFVGMVARNVIDDVPADLFTQLAFELAPHASKGIRPWALADALQKALGQGMDRERITRQWQMLFGRPDYAVPMKNLWGDEVKPSLALVAGSLKATVSLSHLAGFRQVQAGGRRFLVVEVQQPAKVRLGQDLDIGFQSLTPDQLVQWMQQW